MLMIDSEATNPVVANGMSDPSICSPCREDSGMDSRNREGIHRVREGNSECHWPLGGETEDISMDPMGSRQLLHTIDVLHEFAYGIESIQFLRQPGD